MLIDDFFQLLPVPALANLFLLHNESRICAEAVNQRFVNSPRRLSIDKTDADFVFVQLIKFTK